MSRYSPGTDSKPREGGVVERDSEVELDARLSSTALEDAETERKESHAELSCERVRATRTGQGVSRSREARHSPPVLRTRAGSHQQSHAGKHEVAIAVSERLESTGEEREQDDVGVEETSSARVLLHHCWLVRRRKLSLLVERVASATMRISISDGAEPRTLVLT